MRSNPQRPRGDLPKIGRDIAYTVFKMDGEHLTWDRCGKLIGIYEPAWWQEDGRATWVSAISACNDNLKSWVAHLSADIWDDL